MLAVIIPWREVPTRRKALNAVVDCLVEQLHAGMLVVVSEHNSSHEFCKSKAVNDGVRQTRVDRFLIHDADILVPPGYIDRVQECFDAGWEFVQIGKDIQLLTALQTELYYQRPGPVAELVSEYNHSNFPMGSVGITREAYARIGGMNERYVGWGHEDKSFLRQALALTKNYTAPEVRFVHLWHEIANRTTGSLDTFKAELELTPTEVAARNQTENELCPM